MPSTTSLKFALIKKNLLYYFKETIGFLIVIFICTTIFAQEKRISKKKVPERIHKYLHINFPVAHKIKFFQSTEKEKTFIEAEFIHKHVEYSLKFIGDSLIETEIDIKFSDIPTIAQSNIKASLDSTYSTYKIIVCEEIIQNTNKMYEINIKSKDGNFFELIFNNIGTLIKKVEIVGKPIPSQF